MYFEIGLFIFGFVLLVGYLSWRLKKNAKYYPDSKWFEIETDVLGQEQIEFYKKLDSELLDLGFLFFKMTKHENWTATSIQRIYYSDKVPTVFLMMESWAKNAKTRRILQFRTRFKDGSYISTSAPRSTSGLFKPLPKYKVTAFWEPKQPAELFRIHQKTLEKENKEAEQLFPERFPFEIDNEKREFLEMRLKCGDFIKREGNDFYNYTWKLAIRTVLIMTNPFGRSVGVRYQWLKMLSAFFIFSTVMWAPQLLSAWLIDRKSLWINYLVTIFFPPLVFYLGGFFLKKTGVKSIVAAYLLSFFPLAYVFNTTVSSAYYCLLLLLLGVSVDEKAKA